jgi:hypothetical protein
MVTDKQVLLLWRALHEGFPQHVAAAKAGMDRKTARRYMRLETLPSEKPGAQHAWRNRPDPFEDVWPYVRSLLSVNAGLEATTVFESLQRMHPGHFPDGQLRTLQRRFKVWRATEGPAKEIFFEQVYLPGDRSESDFTHMNSLRVTIAGVPFPHMTYHFVLCRSNWEDATVCFSESFEALSEGLQNAMFRLGRVPRYHQTDRLSAAVHQDLNAAVFTDRYQGLLRHLGVEPLRIQAEAPHENGDIEQRHHRFKRAVDQQLMLRGSRDFASRADYEKFLRQLLDQLNAGRQEALAEELAVMRPVPVRRLESAGPPIDVRVTKFSTIRVLANTYSVHSRLRDERVRVRVYLDRIEVWYAQKLMHTLPRLHGKKKHRIDYRHVIDWLVRKPGAFAHYRYHSDLFPTHRFRVAYDLLRHTRPLQASAEYLAILHLAATENETAVDEALRHLIDTEEPIAVDRIKELVARATALPSPREVRVDPVHLDHYDALLPHSGDGCTHLITEPTPS